MKGCGCLFSSRPSPLRSFQSGQILGLVGQRTLLAPMEQNLCTRYWKFFLPNSNSSKLWTFPIPFGGDLLITIIVQTTLTFIITSYAVSVDLKNGPKWCLFGISVIPQKFSCRCCNRIFKYFRSYKPAFTPFSFS